MALSRLNRLVRKLKQVELFDSAGMSQALRSSLYWGIWAVSAGMLCFNVTTGAAWTGFQREVLGADDFQLGLIAAIPVAANVLQILFSFFMERKRNRRFLFLFFGIVGRSLWILIGLIPFFVPASLQMVRILATIALVMMVSMGNSFVGIGFGSLMGDLVPLRIRGQYFSARQRVALVAGILAGLLVSYVIDTMGTVGYSIVLILAGIAGIADICCFFFVKWPPMAGSETAEAPESPLKMISGVFKNKRYMRFCLFFTCWHFSVALSTPFNNVYLIEVMKLSFVEITLFTQIVSNLATVFSVTFWGRAIDRYGNKPVMRFVGAICMFLSGLWLFMQPGSVGMVIFFHFMTGLFWISIDLGQQNLYLALSPQKNRSVYIAVFSALANLCGIALGNTLGGALVQGPFTAMAATGFSLAGIVLNKYHYIFLFSTILRIIVMLTLLPRVQEEGSVPVKEMLQSAKADYVLRFRQLYASVVRTRIIRRYHKQNKQESE